MLFRIWFMDKNSVSFFLLLCLHLMVAGAVLIQNSQQHANCQFDSFLDFQPYRNNLLSQLNQWFIIIYDCPESRCIFFFFSCPISFSPFKLNVCFPIYHVSYFLYLPHGVQDFPGGSVVNNLSAMQETWVQSLGQQYPLKKKIATHSSIPAWKIPQREEPGSLQSMGLKRARYN